MRNHDPKWNYGRRMKKSDLRQEWNHRMMTKAIRSHERIESGVMKRTK